MNQILLITALSLGVLLFINLICLFFISRKSQRVMQSLLEIMTNPEQAKVQDATRVLQTILKDEITKIDDNFKQMANALQNQIVRSEEIKKNLGEQNDKMVLTADEAVKKIATMSQRLDNTVTGLGEIVASAGWADVQHSVDNFSATTESLLNRISETTTTTTQHATQLQEQITQSLDTEHQISEQLQSTFNSNT
ncbi:MAG: hypothetical protein ACLRFP_00010, partial [Alphaproteobacteria bacterium]